MPTKGFFSDIETQSTTRPNGRLVSCVSCGRGVNCKNPKTQTMGEGRKRILNVFPTPSTSEDRSGNPYTSADILIARRMLKKQEINLDTDCWNTYAVLCASPKEPSEYQVECCQKFVLQTIKEKSPHIVILWGEIPLQSVIGNFWKKDLSIKKFRGFQIPDQTLGAYVCPIFDLNYIATAKNKAVQTVAERDLIAALSCLTKEFPTNIPPKIHSITDLSVLREIQSGSVAVDYETTGLKPYAAGHKIVCVSVAISESEVYVFPMPETKKERAPFVELLQNPNVGKIAANMKFEDTWTNVRLRTPISNWEWDTMQAAHILDNRPGITGLKLQTYLNFGITDYSITVEPYLKATDSNSKNKLEEYFSTDAGKYEVLKYCALDALHEFRLAKKQQEIINGNMKGSPFSIKVRDAYKLFHDGILALGRAERQGIRIDLEYTNRKKNAVSRQIERLEKKFMDTAFFKDWQKNSKKSVNINSDKELGDYLYAIRKIMPKKLTESGKGSTDEEALMSLGIPELEILIQRSKLMKNRDTYLEGFLREQTDGILHPFFNLHQVVTYRSSSSNPNFQNIPKRDKAVMKLVRDAIYPRKGNQLLEFDFGGIEVAVAACYHKDPNMIKYITDPHSDMHGDMAAQIFKITDFNRGREDHSTLRSAAKNGFVFPQFYGDYYKNNAENICGNWVNLPTGKWKDGIGFQFSDGTYISEHFRKNGIKSMEDFTNYIQEIEKHFWTKRFPDYAKWKDRHVEAYQKNGYATFYTGFSAQGVMSRNDVINYPVQGTAFHLLLWLFIQVDSEIQKRGLQTRLVGQIHDALVLDVYPPELDEIYDIIIHLGTIVIREVFPWILVPLELEAELCEIDGSWATKKKYKKIK